MVDEVILDYSRKRFCLRSGVQRASGLKRRLSGAQNHRKPIMAHRANTNQPHVFPRRVHLLASIHLFYFFPSNIRKSGLSIWGALKAYVPLSLESYELYCFLGKLGSCSKLFFFLFHLHSQCQLLL